MPTSKAKPTTSSLQLKGVGKQIAKHLAKLEIHTLSDLLFHLPYRYQDRTHLQPIRSLIPNTEVVVEGTITAVTSVQKGRTKLLCELRDETGRLYLRFFNVLSFQADILKKGTRLRCYSEVRMGPKGLEMVHPELKVIREGHPAPIETHLTPIYPATEGLSQYALRKLTVNALELLQGDNSFEELIPQHILPQNISFKEAVKFIHRPPQETPLQALLDGKTHAQHRLVFEELLTHRISLLNLKQDFQSQKSFQLPIKTNLTKPFLESLPFKLTNAQQRVIQEIQNDLSRSYPMLRLVQGDVGSGKTVVAACAMLQAIENKHQALMMAPTELLAEQHHRVFKRWLEPMGLNVVFLSGNVKGKARTAVLQAIESGEAQIVLGTHALFQHEVNFSNLALIVVDEQHRFGVQQRAMLREKGTGSGDYPHQLIMTATPIPRTLAMSFYADLDCSVIDELPPNRTPIKTSVLASSKRDEVIARIQEACQQGRQVYWVCPLIDESEVLACQAATQTHEQLQACLPDLKVGLIHGKMRAQEKEATMSLFQKGDIDLLVATTVIEVGVDVPNASVMVIENAERLGLSQLHQLRGRVGRGSVASHCILLYQYPLSDLAKERLAVMRETTDGFKIAQRDLELRGPGEVLGTRQTGDLTFRIADLLRDSNILAEVQQAADIIIRDHSEIIRPLMQRWLKVDADYGKV